MKRRHARLSGFTLFEAIVTSVIMAVAVGTLVTLAQAGRISWEIGDEAAEVEHNLQQATTWMSRELVASATAQVAIDPAQNRLTFAVPVDESVVGTDDLQIVWGAEGNPGWRIEYLLGGAPGTPQLLRQLRDNLGAPQGTPTVLANYVRSFVITGEPDIVQPVTVRLELTVARGAMQREGRTYVRLRN